MHQMIFFTFLQFNDENFSIIHGQKMIFFFKIKYKIYNILNNLRTKNKFRQNLRTMIIH